MREQRCAGLAHRNYAGHGARCSGEHTVTDPAGSGDDGTETQTWVQHGIIHLADHVCQSLVSGKFHIVHKSIPGVRQGRIPVRLYVPAPRGLTDALVIGSEPGRAGSSGRMWSKCLGDRRRLSLGFCSINA